MTKRTIDEIFRNVTNLLKLKLGLGTKFHYN